MKDTITFRLMQPKDIDQVWEIEKISFPSPWSREAFYNELHHNHFANYVVMINGDRVIGYGGVWIIVDEAHITNIAVLPEYRGKGLGEALMKKMMELAKHLGATKMTLEVRVSNHVAQSLYRKLGFQNGGIRKQYYTDNQEDALVMWVNL